MGTYLGKPTTSRYKPARNTMSNIHRFPQRSTSFPNTHIQINAREAPPNEGRLESSRTRSLHNYLYYSMNLNLSLRLPKSLATAKGHPMAKWKRNNLTGESHRSNPRLRHSATSDQNNHHQHLEHEALSKGLQPRHLHVVSAGDAKPSEILHSFKHTEKAPSLDAPKKTGISGVKEILPLLGRRADNSNCSGQTEKSSIKSTRDLFLAEKSFEYNNEAVLPPILIGLIESHNRKNIIPAVVKNHVKNVLDKNEVMQSWMIDQHSSMTDCEEALQELREIQVILHESRYCTRERASEAAWNDGVTSRILFLAMRQEKNVRHHNITTAHVASSLIPKDLSGARFPGKLVDYSINLVTPPDTADKGVVKDSLGNSIRELLAHVPRDHQTINQTMYGPVRYDPAGVSIETKAKSTLDGRAQLSIWIAAWLQQMRYLRAVAADPESKDWESSEIYRQPVEIKMPLIVAAEGMWKLHLASDERDKIVVSSLFSIGDTDSVLGIYNLVKSLRILALWVNGPFRDFMCSKILQPSPNSIW